jgi:hypothetical protein
MRKLIALFLPIAVFGCSLSVFQSRPTASPAAIEVGEFPIAQAGSGCGMTLWKPERKPQDDRFILVSTLKGTMQMQLDGQMIQFDRIQSSGQAFYGQQTSQAYRSVDGSTIVNVEVTPGEKGEIESVAIPTGTIRISKNGREMAIAVQGDAGC